jgi:nucleoside-diphosphate-sugar epimerase
MDGYVEPSVDGKRMRMPIIDSKTDWTGWLDGIDAVIHLAAMVHVMQPWADSVMTEFREVNVEGTARLAAAAAAAGVKRLVYLSSIKVNGEVTFEEPFEADQSPLPLDPYGISKAEAESRLNCVEAETGIATVIIRPPLVYGPGMKGNLLALSNAIDLGIPLPFGAVDNRRDLVSVYNLCDLIAVCVVHDRAAGHVFLTSDNETLSTPELIRHIARARSIEPRLFRVPVPALRWLGRLVGKARQVDRLVGNLEVDTRHTSEILGWRPPLSVSESFAKMYREK